MSTVRAFNFQHPSAANPAIVLAADGTAAATVSGINGGPLAGFRNAIINGNFDVWQRGTSFTGLQYGADRWVNERSGTTCTMSRQPFTVGQADVPDNPTWFCRMVVGSITGASNFSAMYQNIESVGTFAGSTATLSFWIKADATKQVAVDALQFFGTGGSPSATIGGIGAAKFTIGTTWQKIVHTITVPSISGKTIGTVGDDYLRIRIWFDAGSNQNPLTNSLGHQSGTFEIAQVQLEPGSVATPFEHRPIGTELALCYRYYIQLAESDLMGGANQRRYASSGGVVWQAGGASFPSTMRATPNASTSGTVTYSNASGLAYAVTPRSARTEVVPTAAGVYTWGGGATHIFDAEL